MGQAICIASQISAPLQIVWLLMPVLFLQKIPGLNCPQKKGLTGGMNKLKIKP
ncbi:hypothetical protein DPMN_102265 [Dreissena polymorpha]|uniref:Uncharacterized protein n=1 Tax=Dreissena polymorpha TaxID=45954 RepID=A0A9D4LK18_DREPO|nr:hypothetical protein DPMN_102265 [Dreissena polymorpha]